MQPNHQHIVQKDGYYLHAHRYNDDYCIIITDEALSKAQLARLTIYLLEKKMDKSHVIKNIGPYCCDTKIREIKEGLEKTKGIMTKNIDAILERGESIEQLVTKTEELAKSAAPFRYETEELNRGWPCTLL